MEPETNLCNIIGCSIAGEDNFLFRLGTIIQSAFNIIFAGLIIYGIFMIIKAVYKIISSEGDESKLESGLKSVRGVYFGIIIIFVGLIGLVIIFALFNVTELPDVGNAPGINDPFQ
jgi:hypothetical protein